VKSKQRSGHGPAAVTPPFFKKGNPFGNNKPLFQHNVGMGRQPKGWGSQKTLPIFFLAEGPKKNKGATPK